MTTNKSDISYLKTSQAFDVLIHSGKSNSVSQRLCGHHEYVLINSQCTGALNTIQVQLMEQLMAGGSNSEDWNGLLDYWNDSWQSTYPCFRSGSEQYVYIHACRTILNSSVNIFIALGCHSEMIMGFHEYTYQDHEYIIRTMNTMHAQCICYTFNL